nr:hypothetical protein [uncultured Duganella sp.]
MNLTKHLAGLLGAAASFGAAAASPAAANGVMEFPNVRVAAQAPPAPGRAAAPDERMMAYKDPATGKLTAPPPSRVAALAAQSRGAAPKPVISRPPHGGVAAMLEPRHERYAIARRDADGNIVQTCEPDANAGDHHEK